MYENHESENLKDQLRELEGEYDLAEKNRKMFYRLWLKWVNKSRDIESSIHRLNDKIKNTPQ